MKGYINGVQGLNFLAFFVGKIQKNLFISMNGRENFRDDCAILAGRQDQWSAPYISGARICKLRLGGWCKLVLRWTVWGGGGAFGGIFGSNVLSKCPKERHSTRWNIKFQYVFKGGDSLSLAHLLRTLEHGDTEEVHTGVSLQEFRLIN